LRFVAQRQTETEIKSAGVLTSFTDKMCYLLIDCMFVIVSMFLKDKMACSF